MFERYRNDIVATWVAVAIVFSGIVGSLAWGISSDLTEQRVRAEKIAEYHDNYAEDRIDVKCPTLPPADMQKCIHKEIEAARDHERSEQDLNAQQAMARFAKVMGWTAIAGLALGGISIWVIFATLKEMSSTNDIMRDDQRPWVDFEVTLNSFNISDRHMCTVDVDITIFNRGKSPAVDVIVQAQPLRAQVFGQNFRHSDANIEKRSIIFPDTDTKVKNLWGINRLKFDLDDPKHPNPLDVIVCVSYARKANSRREFFTAHQYEVMVGPSFIFSAGEFFQPGRGLNFILKRADAKTQVQ